MSSQPQAYQFGTNPCRDLSFIIKHYNFSFPFKEGDPSRYEFSLMLEELYQIPIESDSLVNLAIEEVASMLNEAIAIRKRLPKHKLTGKILLVVGSEDEDKTSCLLNTLVRYDVKLVLLTASIPSWEYPYIKDFICCDFKNRDYISRLKLYQEKVGKFDGLVADEPYAALANELKAIFGLPNVLSKALLLPKVTNDLDYASLSAGA